MSDIFNNKKKNEILRITPSNIDNELLYDEINEFYLSNEKLKKEKKKNDLLKNKLKEISLNEYLSYYSLYNKNPGSIIIESEKDGLIAEYMFVPSDRYLTIKTEKEANKLEKIFGDSIIERKLTYSFDPKMLEKYSEIISKLIEECDDIDQNDKSKLFIGSETYKVKNGTIDNLSELNESMNIKEVFEAIKPVVSIKNPKILKS